MASSRPRTLSIGSSTYDLFVRPTGDAFRTDASGTMITLPVGHKIRIQEVLETCGGGAANTAVGLSRLGFRAGFAGVIGSDQWGERMLVNLKKENVDVQSATIIEGETSCFSLIFNLESGERVILYSNGVNAHLDDVTFDRDALATVDWVFFNHIHEKSCVIEDDLIAALQTYPAPGLTWNPGGRQLKQGIDQSENALLLKRTSLLLLNKEEGLKFSGKHSVEQAIRTLLNAGAKIVCITDGSHGCTASDGRQLYCCPVISDAHIIDTTGAGDAFGTGATWALLSGRDLPTALRAGTINATSVLGTIGAQAGLLTDIEMQERLRSTELPVDVRPLS